MDSTEFHDQLVATDRDGLSFEQEFTITVGNLPEEPTDLVLENSSVAENSARLDCWYA